MSVDKNTIETKVIAIIAEQLSIDKTAISCDTLFARDLAADSLDIIEWVLDCEAAFDIRIPDVDIEKLKTVGEVVDYITMIIRSKD